MAWYLFKCRITFKMAAEHFPLRHVSIGYISMEWLHPSFIFGLRVSPLSLFFKISSLKRLKVSAERVHQRTTIQHVRTVCAAALQPAHLLALADESTATQNVPSRYEKTNNLRNVSLICYQFKTTAGSRSIWPAVGVICQWLVIRKQLKVHFDSVIKKRTARTQIVLMSVPYFRQSWGH